MSRDAGNPEAPRRPKATPPHVPSPPREEPTTWRPNPKKSPAPGAGAKLPGARTGERSEPSREPVGKGPGWLERIVFGRVGTGQLAVFCRQFGHYLNAGVDILKALTNLEKQFAHSALGPVIGRITIGVRRGDPLAEVVAREPQAFDTLFVSMIRVAEARGGLPETLLRLSQHYEARQSLIRQARSAMIYPIAVLVIASGVVGLITVFLLPKFIELLKDVGGRGAELPLPSRVLMAFSGFVATLGWWLIPIVAVGFPLGLLWCYRTRIGKRLMDEVAIRIPVFGSLLRKIDTTRFARTLSTLLGSGVDVGTSLDLTADVMRLDPFRRAIRRARSGVIDGSEISESLALTHRFGPDVIAVMSSGEETGKLPESLERLADDYEEQVAYMVRNMGQLVQPLLMVLLGGIVLFIILAVLLPYISLLNNLAGAS